MHGLNINEQNDGSWKVGAKVILDHTGHEIGPDIFATYSFAKKLSKDDIDFIILLAKSKAPVRKIAEMLSTRTGDHYKSKDVRNVLTKHKAKLDGGNLIVNEPLSPGGQIMREEEKTKRMTKALKFNKVKVQSEILSQQNQRTFDEHLKASKNFLSLLKHGLPEELMNYLDSPTRYSITEESDLESDNNETATKEVSQSLPNHHEVPAALAVLFGFDCLVREVDPDGGCLFGSLNVHLFRNTN